MIRLTLLFILASTFSNAQDAQREINEQVWKPFTKAIMSQDVEKFISVHSKDIIRAERDSKKILDYEKYKSEMEKSWPGWKQNIEKNKTKYVFELRFLERISDGDNAFEVGYFKNETTDPQGNVRKSYGKFYVALRKENGVWKILVDSDSNEGRTITEEMFLAASPIQ